MDGFRRGGGAIADGLGETNGAVSKFYSNLLYFIKLS